MQIIHIKQPNRKTYSLQFDFEGNLVVKTDTRFFGNKLDEILKKHNTWIKLNFKRIREQLNLAKQDYLKDGFEYTILGEKYKLKYKFEETNYFSIQFDSNKILITQPFAGKLNKAEVKKELIKFFKIIAKDYLTQRTEVFTKKANLSFKKIYIKNQKTKWGSCSSENNLNYNWHLIFAPKKVIDYVVIHEICHLRHMNHSKYFWNAVAKLDPQYQESMKWLKENEHIVRILN